MEAENSWRLAWDQRPPEEAHNLNPAFCGELIARTVCDFHKARRAPMNLAVSFLVLPLSLHEPTRDQLPKRADVAFAGWVADKNSLLAELPLRVNQLRSITREALMFSIQHALLAIEEGGLVPGIYPVRHAAKMAPTTDDANEARRASGMLGRWFANQGSQSAILQGMGVAP